MEGQIKSHDKSNKSFYFFSVPSETNKRRRRPSTAVSTCLDLDPVQLGGELVVDCKHVAVLDLLGLWLFGEDPLGGLPAGQRLQRSHQLPLGDVCLLLDLLPGPEEEEEW